jgi:hypothetical protein
MPLKSGYSRKTIDANIAQMIREGYAPNVARAASMSNARKCWFKKSPNGFLYAELAYSKDKRHASDYDTNGKPYGDNPRQPAARDLDQARALFRGFTGEEPQGVTRLKIKPFSTGLAIGKILAIIYEVSATGEKLKHSFKDSARPHLIVSSDGHQVLICGGKFTFTSRGFVDK